MSFFPEGGNFPEGIFSRIAFKALDRHGASECITGEIVDEEGNRIKEVTSVFAGMGSFVFKPEAGKEYFLVSRNNHGQEKRFKLPPAKNIFTLGAYYRNKRHFIQVNKSPGMPEKPLYLLVHCKGEVLYGDFWDHRREYISFLSDLLPPGVLQVLLFDERMNLVSERLLFNKNENKTLLTFTSDKKHYQKREMISVDIHVTDPEGIPLAGHISVSVTDDNDVAIDSLHTISASLLLSSELRGYIESPGYYLQDHAEAELALDHLMMIHGWRRYEVAEAIKGNFRPPETGFEVSKVISGSVKSLLSGKPVVNGEVLFFSNDGNFGQTETNDAGQFHFDLHYPENVNFFVQARNQKGKDGVELILKQEQFPKLEHIPAGLMFSHTGMDKTDFIQKAKQRSQYDDDMRTILLSEVTVTAKRIEKKDEARLSFWYNSSSDATIYREQIEQRAVQRVTDLFYTVAGVRVNPDGTVNIRGVGSITGRGLPLVIIDGIYLDWTDYDSPLEMVNIHDIETIDVFKGASTSIFGLRGADGAISITTKREISPGNISEFNANCASITPTGYQKPVEFYDHRNDTPKSRNLSLPDYRTTIFWKPDIILPDAGKATFDFYASDFPTTYSIVIEGLSNNGKIIRKIETIEVGNFSIPH